MILKIRILKLCYSNNKLGIKWVMRNVVLHKLSVLSSRSREGKKS